MAEENHGHGCLWIIIIYLFLGMCSLKARLDKIDPPEDKKVESVEK